MRETERTSPSCPTTLLDLADDASALGLRRAARALASVAMARALTRVRSAREDDRGLAMVLTRAAAHGAELDAEPLVLEAAE